MQDNNNNNNNNNIYNSNNNNNKNSNSRMVFYLDFAKVLPFSIIIIILIAIVYLSFMTLP